MKHLSIKVHGRVQGVFYRAEAGEKATELGLFGFAKNAPDRTVTLEAEGPEPVLEKFLDWCRQGPRMAHVEKVEYLYTDDLKNFTNFSIQ